MKFTATLAVLLASANGIATTTNDCRNGEGAERLSSCRSLWYSECAHYTIYADDTCNFETHGDASLNWFSSDLEVQMWQLTWQNKNAETSQDEAMP